MSFQEPNYSQKLENNFPTSRNASDPSNRQMRETFFLMKDFGYDNFEKNNVVITKFRDQGNLDNMMGIQQALEQSYAQNAAPAQRPVAKPVQQPPPQESAAQRQQSLVVDTKKIAYSEKVNKKLKDPQKMVMLQLMELGYLDYDKNLKIVKKEKRPDISVVLDKLNRA